MWRDAGKWEIANALRNCCFAGTSMALPPTSNEPLESIEQHELPLCVCVLCVRVRVFYVERAFSVVFEACAGA